MPLAKAEERGCVSPAAPMNFEAIGRIEFTRIEGQHMDFFESVRFFNAQAR
jgi:hypothetical protein